MGAPPLLWNQLADGIAAASATSTPQSDFTQRSLCRKRLGLSIVAGHAIVFDLPQTVESTKKIIADFGAANLVTTRAGDYFKDDFGQGNDVMLLSAILHSMRPKRNRGLLQKAYDSLVPGGLVVVHEGLISEDGASPLQAVLFSLNMLVNTGEG